MPAAAATDARETRHDLVVVGAGVNGAGIAHDAALRGLDVLLLDKGDVCDATSGWSSRLIHGGLRYLEHLELGLVRESLNERETLLRVAPHLVRPLDMLIPIYRGARRGRFTIRLGLMVYDLLSLRKSLARHRMLSRSAALGRVPGLARDGLVGAALYQDAQVAFAERLVLENVLAARAAGADVRTHHRVERLLVEEGTCRGVVHRDLRSGAETRALAPLTVNVSGPWVDDVLAHGAGGQPLVGGTKGSHVVVARLEGVDDALYVEAGSDHRPFFIIPWNGQHLIGTTDERYEGDLDGVTASSEEVEYLLAETRRVLPRARLEEGRLHYTYAGVRPLPHTRGRAAGAITRRHVVHDHAPAVRGLLSIVGGKLTTYRSLAEDAVDRVVRALGRPRAPCRTSSARLPGAPDDVEAHAAALRARSPLPPAGTEHLLRVYGCRAGDVLERARDAPDLLEGFCPHTGATGAALVFAFEEELAQTLADALLRRTMAGLGPRRGLDVVEAAAAVCRRHLGWDAERAREEVEGYREAVAGMRVPRVGAVP